MERHGQECTCMGPAFAIDTHRTPLLSLLGSAWVTFTGPIAFFVCHHTRITERRIDTIQTDIYDDAFRREEGRDAWKPKANNCCKAS